MTERVIDFGGTGEPGLSLMANNTDVRLLFADEQQRYGPFFRGLEMPGEWRHVVVNIDRDREIMIYVDGEKLASEDIRASAGRNIPAAGQFLLGRYRNDYSRYNWPGDMDQLRIYKRALSPGEIAALYREPPR